MNNEISSNNSYIDEQTYGESLNKLASTPLDTSDIDTFAGIAVLAEFLRRYRPGNRDEHCPDNLSSAEIAMLLNDIALIPINVIAAVMPTLGYGIHLNENGCPEWAMIKI